ncbi:CoA transferase [Burkholderia anthina]|uniref:CoA transferase n=1 Tax=Burkholderia anthina TaxID=179879 RepID=UPI001CF2419C|nr:CoA transferase [Burkholderia anthina]MCA8094866.1 CoA transferase [Burkholderia anthina]
MLAGLRVIDLGVGMAAALVVKALADFGARVTRIEPDGGDPTCEHYAAGAVWRARTQRCPATDDDALHAQLAQADICIAGGEDWPGLRGRADAATLRARHARLIVVDMGGGANATAPAVDLLAQARSGLAFELFSARPLCFAIPVPTYGAALLGLIGIGAALVQRLGTQRGMLVKASLEQGVGLFWSPFLLRAQTPDAVFSSITPKDCRHLIFECKDGRFVQFVMGVPGAVAKLYGVLGIDVPVDPADRGVPKAGAAPERYFGDLALIGAHVKYFERDALLAALWREGMAAEPVLQPGECWDDAQVLACGLIERDAQGRRGVGRAFDLTPLERAANGSRPAPADPASRGGRAAAGSDALPLAGVRIVDLGNFVAGPYASRLLGDLGADVVKVESPAGSATISGYRTVYSSNCNKRSVCIDLKTPDGMAVLDALCDSADVVHHNFRVGVAGRLGVAPAQLRARRRKDLPGLVTLETTAYGQQGPKAHNPGFDMVMQALCGHEARAGGAGNVPLWPRSPLVDYAAGALGAVAMLMALYAGRSRGCAVEAHVSLLASALFLQSELTWSPDAGFRGAPLLDREMTGHAPWECLYALSDGWLALALRDDAMAARFAAQLELEGLPYRRGDWGDAERAAIGARLMTREGAATLAALRECDVWAELCALDAWRVLGATDEAHPASPLARCVRSVSDGRYGRVTGLVGTLLDLEDASGDDSHLRAAPQLGEHTLEVLGELGYTSEQLAALMGRGVVACMAPG